MTTYSSEKKFKIKTDFRVNDFTIEEARGFTIQQLRYIEIWLNKMIIDFVAPQNKSFFQNVMLNSSILDIGDKIKIIKNIGSVDKKTIDNIRKLAAIRNGFAHAPIAEKYTKIAYSRKNGVEIISPEHISEHIIHVMNASGEIKVKNAMDYLDEFIAIMNEVLEKI